MINEVSRVTAGLYTNLYTTYVGGWGQVPCKKYINSSMNLSTQRINKRYAYCIIKLGPPELTRPSVDLGHPSIIYNTPTSDY